LHGGAPRHNQICQRPFQPSRSSRLFVTYCRRPHDELPQERRADRQPALPQPAASKARRRMLVPQGQDAARARHDCVCSHSPRAEIAGPSRGRSEPKPGQTLFTGFSSRMPQFPGRKSPRRGTFDWRSFWPASCVDRFLNCGFPQVQALSHAMGNSPLVPEDYRSVDSSRESCEKKRLSWPVLRCFKPKASVSRWSRFMIGLAGTVELKQLPGFFD